MNFSTFDLFTDFRACDTVFASALENFFFATISAMAFLLSQYFSRTNDTTLGCVAIQALITVGLIVNAHAAANAPLQYVPTLLPLAFSISSYAFIASTLSPSHGSIFSSLVSFASFHFPVIFASVDMALSFSVPSELNISFFTFFRSATSGAYCASSSASHLILSFAIVFISALTSFTILLA